MIQITEKYNCSGCHACKSVCPKSCITMEEDGEGFKYPKANAELCINCGLCERVCPILHHQTNCNTPTAYAAINIDDEIRANSSSGGIYYLLAKHVILNGGVVFGAKFDANFKVVHGYAQTIEEAKAFMGSKYTQSDMGDNYLYAKEYLDAGKTVLFTGTPCQIAGLKAFLRHEYENLICQDIICHGVPSPKVWEKYLNIHETKASATTRKAFFRSKTYGWKAFSMRLEFTNGKEFEEIHRTDLFMQGFLKNLCLRPSCYHCSFKSKSRSADITLADFWGIQHVMPEMDDDKGTSLVVVHSQKGKQLFEAIKRNLKYKPVDLDLAIQYNPSMIKSVTERPEREKFITEIQKKRFDKVVNKYCNPKVTLITRIKRKIKSIIKKMI